LQLKQKLQQRLQLMRPQLIKKLNSLSALS
jgi:hypothetical protein